MPVEHPRMTGISDPGYNPRFNAQKKKAPGGISPRQRPLLNGICL
jgi:hypothetical protein